MNEVRVTRLAAGCSHYATFQSHNQKVVQTPLGIFVTHLVTHKPESSRGSWRLLRSTDGGASFSCVYASPENHSAKTPCIEALPDGDLVGLCENRDDPVNGLLFLRFRAGDGFQEPEEIPVGPIGPGKFAMVYHPGSDRIYAWSHYGRLLVLDPRAGFRRGSSEKTVRRRVDVVSPEGPSAFVQYPHVCLEGNALHHAWTSQAWTSRKNREIVNWDIHYARSADFGETWTRADGTPLSLPIVPDETGQADQIILPDEFNVHTWLTSMIATPGKVHLAYFARSPINREHYVRIDGATGRIDKNVHPVWKGDRVDISGLDGFFATRRGGPLVYVGWSPGPRIGALISRDGGDTWRDLALSEPVPTHMYSVGGCREITPDGHVIGTFTDQRGTSGDPYFFKISVNDV